MGQMRMAANGRPTGLDMGAVIALMTARKCASAEVLDLISAGEAAMVAAMNSTDE